MSTLSELRERVRDRADIEQETKRYPDAEINGYINDSYKELYGLLLRKSLIRPEVHYEITANGSQTYAVPADHFGTLAVFRDHSGGDFAPLRRHQFDTRPFGTNTEVTGEAYSYRIAEIGGSKLLELYPKPDGETYWLSYIPRPSLLALDTDTIDEVLAWDEYVVIDAAIKALRKENSDTRALQNDKLTILARIEDEAEQVEASEAMTVRDTRKDDSFRDGADWRWYRKSGFPL